MKKIIFTILIIACIALTAQAQENKTLAPNNTEQRDYKHSIRLLPLPTLTGLGVEAEYERAIKSNFSLNFKVYGQHYTSDIYRNGSFRMDRETYEIQLEISGRYYLTKSKNAPKGWFVSPGIIGGFREVNYEESTTDNYRSYNTFQVGTSFKSGYQWVFKSGLTLGAAGGVNYIYEFSRSTSGSIGPIIESSIGYSW